jgi:hypothetical protein
MMGLDIQHNANKLKAQGILPSTWDDAAAVVLNELAFGTGNLLSDFDQDEIEYLYDHGRWCYLARNALAEVLADDDWTLADVLGLLVSKQTDYGPRNILRFGLSGLKVRLWDKVARWGHLDSKDTAQNEPRLDTAIDIVGYVAIALMLRLQWFELPLLSEQEISK